VDTLREDIEALRPVSTRKETTDSVSKTEPRQPQEAERAATTSKPSSPASVDRSTGTYDVVIPPMPVAPEPTVSDHDKGEREAFITELATKIAVLHVDLQRAMTHLTADEIAQLRRYVNKYVLHEVVVALGKMGSTRAFLEGE